jgi:hypothetical protein
MGYVVSHILSPYHVHLASDRNGLPNSLVHPGPPGRVTPVNPKLIEYDLLSQVVLTPHLPPVTYVK